MRRTALLALACLLMALPGPLATAAETGEISLCIVPGGTFAVKRITGPYSKLGAAFGDVVAWIGENGLVIDGRGRSLFHDDPKALPEEKLRSEAWIPVRIDPKKPAPEPAGGVEIHIEPPRLVLRAVHHGPAGEIASTFDRLFRSIPNRGVKYVGPSTHVYLNDLQSTPPADHRIEARIQVEPTGPVDVGIYAGRGAFPEFVLALSTRLSAGKISIRPIGPDEITDGKLAKRCRCLLMPGGWAANYRADLGKVGAKRIREFVTKGNGYIGICAGAFFAAKRIVWEGESIPYPLDLFPGVPTGPIPKIAPWPEFALTKISLDTKHQITKGFPKERTVLYYGGPVLEPLRKGAVKVLARFGKDGDPAIVAFSRGRGRVFLSSVHLEVCLGHDREAIGWPPGEVENPDPEQDAELLRRGAAWVLRL